MCRRMQLSPAIRHGFCVSSTQRWRLKMYSLESVPFLDLVTPHEELKEELTAVFQKALSTASFIGGAMVEDFEKDFAEFCGVQHAVAVSSGTDALRFALMAAGVKA